MEKLLKKSFGVLRMLRDSMKSQKSSNDKKSNYTPHWMYRNE